MNCKPGDLAIITGSSIYTGRLVEVLFAAPVVPFMLPDGFRHDACEYGDWVIKSIGSPFSTTTHSGRFLRFAIYGVGTDSYMRPLPSIKQTESERENDGVPA